MTEPRIVSLIASATEIVCALGFEDSMVGRSHECDYPPSVEGLPVCSSSAPRIVSLAPMDLGDVFDDIPRTAAEMPPLAAYPGWADLSAVRNGRVFLTDGNRHPSAR